MSISLRVRGRHLLRLNVRPRIRRRASCVGGDAGVQGGVLQLSKATQGESDEPQGEQVAAVEGEVQEATEVEKEGMGQVLCFIDRHRAAGA